MEDQGPLRPPNSGRRPDRHRGNPDPSGPRRRAQVISRAEQRAQAVAAIASVIPGPGDAGGMAAMAAVEELRLVVEELRAADDELRTQNTELEMALHCAQDEHCRAFELFEHAPIALLHTDAAGVIREANRNAERLIGCGRQHLLELPLVMFINAGAKRVFREKLRRVLTDGRPQTWDSILGRGALGAEGADGQTVVVPAAAVPGAPALRAVIVTAEAEQKRAPSGRLEPITLIRWAIQDIHELVMARSGQGGNPAPGAEPTS